MRTRTSKKNSRKLLMTVRCLNHLNQEAQMIQLLWVLVVVKIVRSIKLMSGSKGWRRDV